MRNLDRLTRAVAAAALLLLLSGCVHSHERYPVEWGAPPSPPAEGCRQIEGRYRDRGESAAEPGDPGSLAALFGEEGHGATHVSFSMPTDEVLEVTVRAGTEPVLTKTLKRGKHFSCEGGRLRLSGWNFTEGNVVFGVGRTTRSFTASDDHLVAEVKETGGGIVFIVIPLGYSESRWYRFARERDEPPVSLSGSR